MGESWLIRGRSGILLAGRGFMMDYPGRSSAGPLQLRAPFSHGELINNYGHTAGQPDPSAMVLFFLSFYS